MGPLCGLCHTSHILMTPCSAVPGDPPPLLDREQRRTVKAALEVAIERGKIRPYQALELAELLSVSLEPWVSRQAAHLDRAMGPVTPTAENLE